MIAYISSIILQIDSLATGAGKEEVSQSVNMLSTLITIIVLLGLVLIVRAIYLSQKRKEKKLHNKE